MTNELLFTHKLDTCCQAMCQNVKQPRIQPFAKGGLQIGWIPLQFTP